MSDISRQETLLWDLLIMLLSDQNGKEYERHLIDDGEDKTA